MLAEILYAGLALLFVIGLMLALAQIAKRFRLTPLSLPQGSKKSIIVKDMAPIDHKTRLIEVEWRGHTYLLSAGETGVRKIDKATPLSNEDKSENPDQEKQ